ncbi:MAG: hypothetical protein U0228_09830 [Myxococcaceae bacterium]
MPINKLQKLVDTKLQQKKITADDAREVIGLVEKDKKFDVKEARQLERLTKLPATRFQRSDEYIPNPNDPEDGVTIKTDPKKWLETTVQLATAKLSVKHTVPEVEIKLSGTKEFDDEDFGSHFARTVDVTVHGKEVSKDGPIEFSYGTRTIKVDVKKGDSLDKVINRIESALLKKEGTMSVQGFYDEKKIGKQTIKFEVL